MSFGIRLAEERGRLGLGQAEFAALGGTDVGRQRLYETDRRNLRAVYLAQLAEAGVDVGYVLTGRRAEGGRLGQGASDLLTDYFALPDDMRAVLERLARTLHDRIRRNS